MHTPSGAGNFAIVAGRNLTGSIQPPSFSAVTTSQTFHSVSVRFQPQLLVDGGQAQPIIMTSGGNSVFTSAQLLQPARTCSFRSIRHGCANLESHQLASSANRSFAHQSGRRSNPNPNRHGQGTVPRYRTRTRARTKRTRNVPTLASGLYRRFHHRLGHVQLGSRSTGTGRDQRNTCSSNEYADTGFVSCRPTKPSGGLLDQLDDGNRKSGKTLKFAKHKFVGDIRINCRRIKKK